MAGRQQPVKPVRQQPGFEEEAIGLLLLLFRRLPTVSNWLLGPSKPEAQVCGLPWTGSFPVASTSVEGNSPVNLLLGRGPGKEVDIRVWVARKPFEPGRKIPLGWPMIGSAEPGFNYQIRTATARTFCRQNSWYQLTQDGAIYNSSVDWFTNRPLVGYDVTGRNSGRQTLKQVFPHRYHGFQSQSLRQVSCETSESSGSFPSLAEPLPAKSLLTISREV